MRPTGKYVIVRALGRHRWRYAILLRRIGWIWRMLGLCGLLLASAHTLTVRADAGFRFSETSLNLSESNWLGLEERQVFFRSLTHTEEGRSWTMKIGKGGQIYSITTPELGEMVAAQRAKYGQWVDEVFQHVIPMPPQKQVVGKSKVVDGDIHQAGYYTHSDIDACVTVVAA